METTVTSNAKEVINAYTDGSCITQKCLGGWAFILTRADKELERSGHERKTTSNRMELTAAIKALEVIYKKYPNNPITVHTDSQYVKNGITTWIRCWKRNGWRRSDRKPVLNADLWQKLDELDESMNVSWEWVKAHNGHPLNERVHMLAYSAIPQK